MCSPPCPAPRVVRVGGAVADLVDIHAERVPSDLGVVGGVKVEMEDELRGKIKMLGIPTKLSSTPGEIRKMPPVLGEHTIEVLKALGYNEKKIDQLEDKGIIRQYPLKGGESNK